MEKFSQPCVRKDPLMPGYDDGLYPSGASLNSRNPPIASAAIGFEMIGIELPCAI